jgi:antitoxin MazE
MYMTVEKLGEGQAVRIPIDMLRLARFDINEQVKISAEPYRIVIEKMPRREHKTLAERLAGFDEEYVGEEWETGPSVGKEVL